MSERTVGTYALQVVIEEGPPAEEGSAFSAEQDEKRVLSNLPAMLEAVEEDLGQLLPDGWVVRIREWDKEENE